MKASNIRKGILLIHNNVPHRVMEFQHHTPGNLRAMVQVKMRNLMSGNQTEVRYASGDELEEANAFTTPATYLYNDATGYHFMMSESYEEITLQPDLVGESSLYLQDQMSVEMTLWEGEPIGIQLPPTVVLTVVETSPEIRGATASNSPKPAKTDTSLTISVPPFIKEGERVTVRTEDGAYVGRAD